MDFENFDFISLNLLIVVNRYINSVDKQMEDLESSFNAVSAAVISSNQCNKCNADCRAGIIFKK